MSVYKYILSKPLGVASLTILVLVLGTVIFGRALAPYDPLAQNAAAVLSGPTAANWLGTDYVGRDILSRLLAGTALSVLSALEAVLVGLVLGVLPGIASVYAGKAFEWVSLRVMDSFMALPFITFAIAMAALLGNGLQPAMFAVGILIAPTFFRVTRAATLNYNNLQYVEAAHLFGLSTPRILVVHVWRKVVPTVFVTSGGVLAASLLVVASLTFLGIGVQPPHPTWGGMLASDLQYLTQKPFGPVAPALAIMLTVGAIGILSDLVRDSTAGATPRVRRARAADSALKTVPRAPAAAATAATETARPVPGDPLVQIRDLSVSTDAGAELVRSVSLTVPRGGSVGIVGESGSGKTLTCRSLLGILPRGVEVGAGSIRYDGVEILGQPSDDWRALWGKRIGAVFQDPSSYLNPSIRVGDQLIESLRTTGGLSRSAAKAKALDLLTAVGLHEPARVARQYVHQLSGGMLQRVLIAIAIGNEPELLVADEATTALDVTIQAEVLDVLSTLRTERNLTLIMVSHDLAVIAQMCDYLYVFKDGEVVESGPTRDVLASQKHPYTRFLVESHELFGVDRLKPQEATS
jgi:peptide/nickel transport system permease protein